MVTDVSWLEYWSTIILVSSIPSLQTKMLLVAFVAYLPGTLVFICHPNSPFRNALRELGVTVASQQLDGVGCHVVG
jgi:hypothetical protein